MQAVGPGAAQVDRALRRLDGHRASPHDPRERRELLRRLAANAEHGQQGRHLDRRRGAVHELLHRRLRQRRGQVAAAGRQLDRRLDRRTHRALRGAHAGTGGARQERGEQCLTVFGEDRFGVELEPLDRVAPVPDAHHQAVL